MAEKKVDRRTIKALRFWNYVRTCLSGKDIVYQFSRRKKDLTDEQMRDYGWSRITISRLRYFKGLVEKRQ